MNEIRKVFSCVALSFCLHLLQNRAAVGFGTTSEWGKNIELLERVAGLVTLGTPHLPPPDGLMDMTRGALR